MRTALLAIGLLGCSDPATRPPADASVVLDADVADAAPVICDATSQFSAPVLVLGLSTSGLERTVSLSPDELTAYFTGQLGTDTTQEMYMARRPSTAAAFDTPDRLETLSGNGLQFAPSISADGLTLLFASSRIANEGYHLYVTTRSSTLADFGAPSPLAGVASPTVTDTDTQPFLTADGQELWFVSDRSGALSILRAPRVGAGFSNPTSVEEVNFAEGAQFPVLSADRLTIYFATQRTQAGTQGGFDIWTSHRPTVGDNFPAPTPVPVISSISNEEPAWLSADNCRLYLESDRSGTWDIYVATRQTGAL